MGKSPDAFRTISEVAEWLGTQPHVLRFWESKFAQVKPVKRAGGRRYYRPADMLLLGGIKRLLHDDGLTIKGVQKTLREKGVKHVATLSPALEDGLSATPDDTAAAIPDIEDVQELLEETRTDQATAKDDADNQRAWPSQDASPRNVEGIPLAREASPSEPVIDAAPSASEDPVVEADEPVAEPVFVQDETATPEPEAPEELEFVPEPEAPEPELAPAEAASPEPEPVAEAPETPEPTEPSIAEVEAQLGAVSPQDLEAAANPEENAAQSPDIEVEAQTWEDAQEVGTDLGDASASSGEDTLLDLEPEPVAPSPLLPAVELVSEEPQELYATPLTAKLVRVGPAADIAARSEALAPLMAELESLAKSMRDAGLR